MNIPVDIPEELIEALAERVAARLEERLQRESESPYLNVREVAEYLRWPKSRIEKLTAARAIPCRKHAGRLLFRRDEVDVWLDRYREGPRPIDEPLGNLRAKSRFQNVSKKGLRDSAAV